MNCITIIIVVKFVFISLSLLKLNEWSVLFVAKKLSVRRTAQRTFTISYTPL